MNQKRLLEVIGAMKHEILDLIISQNMSDDQTSQQTLSTINEMFKRLNLEVDDVIPEEALKAYFGGVDEATKALKDSGLDDLKHGLEASISSSGKVASAFKSHVHMDAIAEITDDLMLDMKAAIRTTKQSANTAIEGTLSSVKKDLRKGVIQGKARRVVTQKVAESFAKDGMRAFKTVDNRWLDLDFYSQVTTRTMLKSANVKGTANRYRENGENLFTVVGGEPTCNECDPYRGIVFSMDEDDEEFPYLDPDTFPKHPQCGCSLEVYVRDYKSQGELDAAKQKATDFDPDIDTRSASRKKAYEKQQALHRQNNETKKQFARYRSVLDEGDMPKTLGGFKRSKKSNSDNFKEVQRKYREEMKKIRE